MNTHSVVSRLFGRMDDGDYLICEDIRFATAKRREWFAFLEAAAIAVPSTYDTSIFSESTDAVRLMAGSKRSGIVTVRARSNCTSHDW